MPVKKAISAIILMLVLSPIVLAQDRNPALPEDRDRDVTTCFKEFRAFLSATIGYEGFVDYWHDFIRFPLHRIDIESAKSRVDKARRELRSAYLRCERERIDRFVRNYYRAETELYFIRHFVDTKNGVIINHLADENQKRAFFEEMKDFFVLEKGFLTEEVFTSYFDSWAAQYARRAEEYASYKKDQMFKDLKQKFQELLDTFASFQDLGKDIAEPFVEGAKTLWKSPGSIPKAALGRLKNSLGMTVPPERTLEEIAQEFGRNLPFQIGPPISQVQKILREETVRVDREREKQDMLARYQILYGEISGGGISELKQKLDLLKGSLGQSLPILENVLQCSDEFEKRQCKNKK